MQGNTLNLHTPLTSWVRLKDQILKLCRFNFFFFIIIKTLKHTLQAFVMTWMIPKWTSGLDKWDLCFVIYMFLSNNPSSGDIFSLNLSCFSKFHQIWCVNYSHEWHMKWLWGLGEGQKIKYHKISITKSISKIFKPTFVCLLTNKRYETYKTGFSFSCLGHAPGLGLEGARGSKI